jgi:unsaturated rhamnogalacturonyl hydrolase
MKTLEQLFTAFVVLFIIVTCDSGKKIFSENIAYAVRLADSEMKRCPESWQLDFQQTLKWDYCHGVELQAFLNLYEITGDKKYRDYAISYADTMIARDGTIKTYRLEEYNIDRLNTGKILFRIYEYTNDEKYKKAIDLLRTQMNTHPRNEDGGFWHKETYPYQMWLDGLYMAAPFMAEYAVRYNLPDDFKDIVNQFTTVARHTYDPVTGLYRHACDVSRQMFWSDRITGQSKHAWGRAMGWYSMAIVDALDFLPAGEPAQDSLITLLNKIAVQLQRIQDPATGLWYQVLDRSGDEGNYLESSCSAMFMYSLYKAVRKGYIDASYKETADKAYDGYIKEFIETDENGLTNLTRACAVAGLGGKDNRSGDYNYYINELIRANDPKAIGPFINAMIEIELISRSQ